MSKSIKPMIRRLLTLLFLSLSLYAQSGCDRIIPKPQNITAQSGTYTLSKSTKYLSNTPLAHNAIRYLQEHLDLASHFRLQQTKKRSEDLITFHYAPQRVTKSEGYRLSITPKEIRVEARDSAGFFYAIVSLMQLMDSTIWGDKYAQKSWRIASCEIVDAPRYKWRGMMLDSARNFFKPSYIKKFIDRMAQHKLNRFHWHLSDDEGWRIEIKRYPLLTKIGARRGPRTKLPFSIFPTMRGDKDRVQSGYYIQKEIRDIVAYAKARSIEILPEIDIPAHAKAAVVAYPNLLLDPKDSSHSLSVQKVKNNVINPARKSSYIFLDNIIAEVTKIFPFEYIHLGGDEVPAKAWSGSPAVKSLMRREHLKNNKAVENYFFAQADKILSKYNRKLIGWQELINGNANIRKKSIIMAWKSPRAASRAIKKGYQAILSPVQYLYFDQQYIRSKKEYGRTWSTPISTKKLYTYHPKSHKNIQGIQANLWSERLFNTNIADYLTWPRALALCEVAWTKEKKREWKDFRKRAYGVGLERLKVQSIHYRDIQ